MTTTQAQSGTPPLSPEFLASIEAGAAIVVIGSRVATGLPFAMIRRDHIDGEIVVHVERDHLPRWLIEFDIAAPEWEPTPSYDGESVHLRATWPDHAFCHLPIPFRIACSANDPATGGA